MRVTVLGAGDAFSSGGQRQSGYLIETNSATFLLDCGTTTLLALKTLQIPAERIDFVAISHMHGDHFGGLPFLFLEYLHEQPRTRPLHIAGPPGIQDRVLALHRVMYGELSTCAPSFELTFHQLPPGRPACICGVKLLPFRVPHQQDDISLGYRVTVDGKSLLYSGDCGWNEALARYAHGTDLFICEYCYFQTRTSYHISYPQLAEQAPRLACKRLLLSHLGREVLECLPQLRLEWATDGLVVEV